MTGKISMVPTIEADELKASCALLKRQAPIFMEFSKTLAEIRMASYSAHIEEGFSPEQALDLCKQLTL